MLIKYSNFILILWRPTCKKYMVLPLLEGRLIQIQNANKPFIEGRPAFSKKKSCLFDIETAAANKN